MARMTLTEFAFPQLLRTPNTYLSPRLPSFGEVCLLVLAHVLIEVFLLTSEYSLHILDIAHHSCEQNVWTNFCTPLNSMRTSKSSVTVQYLDTSSLNT